MRKSALAVPPVEATGRDAAPQAAAEVIAPVKRRRSPVLIAAGLVLILFSGLGFYWLYRTSDDRIDVVTVSRNVEMGQTVTDSDVVSTQVAVEPGVRVVRWSERAQVIGKVATARLMKGSLLNPDTVSARPIPGPGKKLLGVAVKPGNWPEGQLRPGDQITIISTGAPAATPGGAAQQAQSTPRQIDAVLIDLKASPSTGTTTLIVEVAAADATTLAGYAAGTVSVILDGPK